jgi:hypothetical protein
MELNGTEHSVRCGASDDDVADAELSDRTRKTIALLRKRLVAVMGVSLAPATGRPHGWDLVRLVVRVFGLPFFSKDADTRCGACQSPVLVAGASSFSSWGV